MKYVLTLIGLALLVSCNPQNQYNKIIQDLGYIAYRTPLDSVGAGTIVKGNPNNLIVYTRPERCLPNLLPDGTTTHLRWVSETTLPQTIREAKFNLTTDLSFFGSNGNPLFTVKSGTNYASKIEAKFTSAKIEFIDEFEFWKYYRTKMDEGCKSAVTKFPIFWKSLKVDKMEFVFRNEAGTLLKLSAPMVKEMFDINAEANWSIKNEYTLVFDTPKYIGFLAVKLTEESIRNEQVQVFSNKLDDKGNYIWESIKEKSSTPNRLPLINPKLL